jgi:hypothetical protein
MLRLTIAHAKLACNARQPEPPGSLLRTSAVPGWVGVLAEAIGRIAHAA